MAAVVLRDVVTEDEVEAVMGLRPGPGQDRYLAHGFVGVGEKSGEALLRLDLETPIGGPG